MKNGDIAVKKKAKVQRRESRGGQAKEERKKEQKEEQQKEQQQKAQIPHADYREEACFESFVCAHCGKKIQPEGAGSKHRNHCPHCLYSLHVDETAGDRKAVCHGEMEPIAIVAREDGDWSILHRCKRCGKLNLNRALADDNPILLMQLAVQPLAHPPFPMRYLESFLENRNEEKEDEV